MTPLASPLRRSRLALVAAGTVVAFLLIGLPPATLVDVEPVGVAEASVPPGTDLTIQNASYSTIGHIDADGTVQDSSYRTIGHLNDDGRVQNSSYSTLGYVSGGRIASSSYATSGYYDASGRLQDSSYRTVGYVGSDGRIQDSSYRTVGHVRPGGGDVDAIAAYIFFFEPGLLGL